MTPRGINYWESADGSDRRLLFQRTTTCRRSTRRPASRSRPSATTASSICGRASAAIRRPSAASSRRTPARSSRTCSSSVRRPAKATCRRLAISAPSTSSPASSCGSSTRFRSPASSATTPGRRTPGSTSAARTPGARLPIDAERGIVYFPTGSPTYDFYGADRIGANLFGNWLLALDARTGKRLWHFQMVHHDLWDYDNAAAPQLTTIRHNGQTSTWSRRPARPDSSMCSIA